MFQPEQVHSAAPYALAKQARQCPTPHESRFFAEAKRRWPRVSWRRYAPVTIQAHPDHKSTWFAPFLSLVQKLVVIIDDHPDFPYRIDGQNRALYERHGYTVLDFSEDFSCPCDETVWNEAMARIAAVLPHAQEGG